MLLLHWRRLIRRPAPGERRLAHADAGQIAGGFAERGAPLFHGMVELMQHEAECRQVRFLDRAVIIAVERLAQDIVRLGMQGFQFPQRSGLSRQADRRQQFVAV